MGLDKTAPDYIQQCVWAVFGQSAQVAVYNGETSQVTVVQNMGDSGGTTEANVFPAPDASDDGARYMCATLADVGGVVGSPCHQMARAQAIIQRYEAN